MIYATVRAGRGLRHTEYSDINHFCRVFAFSDEAMLEWLFRQ